MRRIIVMTALTAALALATTGCQGSDRAGGNAGKEVILTFANPNDTPPEQLVRFADEVAKRSAGTLKIDFKNRWRAGERESERGTVRDIRDGKVAMGWVGARVFDQVGVTTFQPLLAPLLVDSQDLQQKVFEAGIPGDMLAGVEKIDLVGVGVLPGPMRKLLSKRGPLTTPAALAGLSVGIQDSRVAEQTFATLGANTVHEQSGAKIADVDGYEQQLSSIWGNHYEEQGARSVVGNLNLWPRPLVILASKQRWEVLSADQHKVLRAAAKQSVQPAQDASRAEDTGSVAPICHAGIAMPQASAAQLAALEKKLAPVYVAISAADSKNKGWLERIRQLGTQVDAGPDTARCTGILPDQGTEGALPDGTYEMTLTPQDINTGCPAGRPGSEYLKPLLNYPKTLQQTVIKGDDVRLYQYPGGVSGRKELGFAATYRVYRDKLEFLEAGTTHPLVFDYSFEGRTLKLSNPNTPSCDHSVVWASHPWVKVQASESSGTIPEGTYTTTLTGREPCNGDGPASYEMIFADGLVSIYVTPRGGARELGFKGSYSVFRDHLKVDASAVGAMTWKLSGNRLVLSDMVGGECGDAAIWTSQPWVKVDPSK